MGVERRVSVEDKKFCTGDIKRIASSAHDWFHFRVARMGKVCSLNVNFDRAILCMVQGIGARPASQLARHHVLLDLSFPSRLPRRIAVVVYHLLFSLSETSCGPPPLQFAAKSPSPKSPG